ncbi:MAG: hypothetical protein OXC28_08890 [Defluviicoccus sp.]|nr:hypothetical protein [Defluviicoccus sp.]
MHVRADLALYDPAGRLVALAEIKNKRGTSRGWAAKTRRNILAHGGISDVDFFLLITPDRLYLWKDAGTDPVEVPPSYQAEADSLFSPYLEGAGVDPRSVGGHAFELIVSAWLSDVMRSAVSTNGHGDDRSWLARSGFHAAVKDGRIEYDAAA